MKPILFNTDMVRAILDDRKTVTRRLMKPQPYSEKTDGPLFWCWKGCQWADGGLGFPESGIEDYAPYKPGDVLYVRETWKNATGDLAGGGYALFDTFVYKADGKVKGDYPIDQLMIEGSWRPSIHMPKEAARLFLRVTDVRAKRLQDMTNEDAEREGARTDERLEIEEEAGSVGLSTSSLREYFGRHIWDSTLKKKDLPRYGWEANPWVFVIEFERAERDSV